MRLRELRNLGPASERMLEMAGITTPEKLDELGSVEAYRRVVEAGAHPSLNLLWALEGALLGLDWRELPERRKQELLDAVGR
jgi:DNA transformation protein